MLGFRGQATGQLTDIEELRNLGYFDLLKHSSLAASSVISASKLAEFRGLPAKQPNQYYLISTITVQLFFERVKELTHEAQKAAHQHSTITTD